MMRKSIIVLILVICCKIDYGQVKSYYEKNFLNCTVLLEKQNNDVLMAHGTGVVIYNQNNPLFAYVVTCEHLLRNKEIFVTIEADSTFIQYMKSKKNGIVINDYLYILANSRLSIKIDLIKDSTYSVNKDLDLGVFVIPAIASAIIDGKEIKIIDWLHPLSKDNIGRKEIVQLGTEVYFVGHPYGIGTIYGYNQTGSFKDMVPNPVVRKGSVAWMAHDDPFFLLDAFSYSGNSGSPIFTSKDIQSKSAYLIGIVTGHLPSQGSDNMGLAKCVWIDYIDELIGKMK